MILEIGSSVVSRLAGKRVNRLTGKPADRLTKNGFTLIEVMLAVTILAIGIVGVIRAYTTAVNGLKAAECSIEEACLLKEKMAEVIEEYIQNPGVSQGTENGEFVDDYAGYDWEKDITVAEFNMEDLKEPLEGFLSKVKVTVTNDRITPSRRFSVATYMESEYFEKE